MEGEWGWERNECVSRKERLLISLKVMHLNTKRHTHTHARACGQDKVLNCGLSELPGAQPSTHAALGFLGQINIVPLYKKKRYSRFVDNLFVRYSDDCSVARCNAFVCFLP